MKIKKKETSIGILGKILNTFSNSKQDTYSCDFINKIGQGIETITNDNGTALKFADGTMICMKIVSNLTLSSPSNLGGYEMYYNQFYWTYPVKFVQIYNVQCSAIDTVGGLFAGEVGGEPTNTSCDMTVYGSKDSTIGASMVAIGRWK